MRKMDPHFLRDANEVIDALAGSVAKFSGKKVLITGGAGFLGSHFAHFFCQLNERGMLDKPCHLSIWDNFSRGVPGWLKGLSSRPGFEIASVDIRRPQKRHKVDFLIHAASIASPIFYRKHPIETMDANVTGLRLLLDSTLEMPVESMLFFSTSEIYGDPDPHSIPTPETYRGNVSCTGPRACYDESKRYGETLCVNFHRVHRTPVKIVRPFNNYGPGLKITDGRVIPDFFRDVLAARDIALLSDGRATRTFCYVSDAITGYLQSLLSSHEGESFNIGTEEPEITMHDLASLVISISGKNLQIRFASSQDPHYGTDNPVRRCPAIQKAKQLLGYSPRISLEEGMARTHLFYLDNPTGSIN